MASLLAYLDLGAGSMLLQMILAGFLGLSYTIKRNWRRIAGYFRSSKADEIEATETESPPAGGRS